MPAKRSSLKAVAIKGILESLELPASVIRSALHKSEHPEQIKPVLGSVLTVIYLNLSRFAPLALPVL